jgi:hypothetical protein
MNAPDTHALFEKLEILLDREKQALANGALEDIKLILDQKSDLLDQLEALDDTSRPDLTGLYEKVTLNQRLLDSALRGVRQVADRMATLRRVRTTLETYNSNGEKSDLSITTTRKLEKRA